MRCVRPLSRLMCHVVAMLLSLLAIRAADAQAIWLVPPGLPHGGLSDFMALFRADAPWQQAAPHVQAFEVIGAMTNQGADKDLAQILGDLRRRNIALVVSIGPLAGAGIGPGHCGFHVEGYSAAGEPLAEALRIAKLGGVAQYFAMDEPLFYGHTFNGQNACHSSIADIAKDVAEKVRQIRTIFPQAQFGEVEPVPIPRMPLDTCKLCRSGDMVRRVPDGRNRAKRWRSTPARCVLERTLATTHTPPGATAETQGHRAADHL